MPLTTSTRRTTRRSPYTPFPKSYDSSSCVYGLTQVVRHARVVRAGCPCGHYAVGTAYAAGQGVYRRLDCVRTSSCVFRPPPSLTDASHDVHPSYDPQIPVYALPQVVRFEFVRIRPDAGRTTCSCRAGGLPVRPLRSWNCVRSRAGGIPPAGLRTHFLMRISPAPVVLSRDRCPSRRPPVVRPADPRIRPSPSRTTRVREYTGRATSACRTRGSRLLVPVL